MGAFLGESAIFPAIHDNTGPLFPHLKTLHIWFSVADNIYLGSANALALSKFLHAHSRTLQELSLPPWRPTVPFSPWPSLKLKQLRCSQALAWLLLLPPSGSRLRSVENLTLDAVSPAFSQAVGPFHYYATMISAPYATIYPQSPYKGVRKLAIVVDRRSEHPTTFAHVPEFFPVLEELEMNLKNVGGLSCIYSACYGKALR